MKSEEIHFLTIMEIAEIQVSYINDNTESVVINNSKDAYDLIIQNWNMNLIQFQEETKIILINTCHSVLGVHCLSKGGISSSIVDIRIILGIALKCVASGIIIVHNHPSGSLIASDLDIKATGKLKNACELMEITLVDHLVISNNDYLSFSDKGYL